MSTENEVKEYVVGLRKKVDQRDYNSLWDLIENKTDKVYCIPDEPLEIINERPGSLRLCHYAMTDTQAEILRNHPDVECVEIPASKRPEIEIGLKLDQVGNFDKTTSAAGNNLNWGLIRHSSDTNVYGNGSVSPLSAYSYFLDGTGVDVVVHDTGLQINHPEFTDAAGVSRVQTINWYAETGLRPRATIDYIDPHGHGTHVGGIMAGKTFGWAKNARIYVLPVQGLVSSGFGVPVEDCFDLVKIWHQKKPIDPTTGFKRPTVVNMSWGYTAPPQLFKNGLYRGQQVVLNESHGKLAQYRMSVRIPSIDIDVQEMADAGIIVVVAAGNNRAKIDAPGGPDYNNIAYIDESLGYGSGSYYYHRGCSPFSENAIQVGSLDYLTVGDEAGTEQKATYSNAGPGVDIFAAGTFIKSSWTNLSSEGAEYYGSSGFKQHNISGTSMASPQVAGIAALYMQIYPDATPDRFYNWLREQSQKFYKSGPTNNDYTNFRSQWGGDTGIIRTPLLSEEIALKKKKITGTINKFTANYTNKVSKKAGGSELNTANGKSYLYDKPGRYEFVVPPDVTILNAICVGGGGGGAGGVAGAKGGGGGALRYVKDFPVKPGEKLVIAVGGGAAPNGNGGASFVTRTGSPILLAGGGRAGAPISNSAGGGGSPLFHLNSTFSPSDGVFTYNNHGLSNGDVVLFRSRDFTTKGIEHVTYALEDAYWSDGYRSTGNPTIDTLTPPNIQLSSESQYYIGDFSPLDFAFRSSGFGGINKLYLHPSDKFVYTPTDYQNDPFPNKNGYTTRWYNFTELTTSPSILKFKYNKNSTSGDPGAGNFSYGISGNNIILRISNFESVSNSNAVSSLDNATGFIGMLSMIPTTNPGQIATFGIYPPFERTSTYFTCYLFHESGKLPSSNGESYTFKTYSSSFGVRKINDQNMFNPNILSVFDNDLLMVVGATKDTFQLVRYFDTIPTYIGAQKNKIPGLMRTTTKVYGNQAVYDTTLPRITKLDRFDSFANLFKVKSVNSYGWEKIHGFTVIYGFFNPVVQSYEYYGPTWDITFKPKIYGMDGIPGTFNGGGGAGGYGTGNLIPLPVSDASAKFKPTYETFDFIDYYPYFTSTNYYQRVAECRKELDWKSSTKNYGWQFNTMTSYNASSGTARGGGGGVHIYLGKPPIQTRPYPVLPPIVEELNFPKPYNYIDSANGKRGTGSSASIKVYLESYGNEYPTAKAVSVGLKTGENIVPANAPATFFPGNGGSGYASDMVIAHPPKMHFLSSSNVVSSSWSANLSLDGQRSGTTKIYIPNHGYNSGEFVAVNFYDEYNDKPIDGVTTVDALNFNKMYTSFFGNPALSAPFRGLMGYITGQHYVHPSFLDGKIIPINYNFGTVDVKEMAKYRSMCSTLDFNEQRRYPNGYKMQFYTNYYYVHVFDKDHVQFIGGDIYRGNGFVSRIDGKLKCYNAEWWNWIQLGLRYDNPVADSETNKPVGIGGTFPSPSSIGTYGVTPRATGWPTYYKWDEQNKTYTKPTTVKYHVETIYSTSSIVHKDSKGLVLNISSSMWNGIPGNVSNVSLTSTGAFFGNIDATKFEFVLGRPILGYDYNQYSGYTSLRGSFRHRTGPLFLANSNSNLELTTTIANSSIKLQSYRADNVYLNPFLLATVESNTGNSYSEVFGENSTLSTDGFSISANGAGGRGGLRGGGGGPGTLTLPGGPGANGFVLLVTNKSKLFPGLYGLLDEYNSTPIGNTGFKVDETFEQMIASYENAYSFNEIVPTIPEGVSGEINILNSESPDVNI